MATMQDFALEYLKILPAVVPVGAWTFTGNDGKEVDLWKAPLIKNWTEKPLTEAREVRKEWSKYAYYKKAPNIGIATGQICGGYIVIDLDRHPERGVDGYEYLIDWQRETGMSIPEETWTAITGSGGYHLWFHTSKAMRSYANHEIGVDLRADGGQVLVPPSLHKSGKRYTWEIGPGECKCAEADEAVMAFIEYCRPSGSQYAGPSTRREDGGERSMLLPPEIPDGGRHTPLISLIGTLNRLGVSDEAIEYTVRLENEKKCKPPLTESELQKEIFPAIYRWAKGISKEQWQQREDFLSQKKAAARQAYRKDQALRRLQNEKP